MKLDFERFLNENGVKVGDKVKLENGNIYKIYKHKEGSIFLKNIDKSYTDYNLIALSLYEFEKVEQKSKIGELMCYDTYCGKCPLNSLVCAGGKGSTLRERFKLTLEKYPELEPMRTYLENELNKEVEE